MFKKLPERCKKFVKEKKIQNLQQGASAIIGGTFHLCEEPNRQSMGILVN